MAKLTREEMETTIRTDASDPFAHIFSSDPVFVRRLTKLCEEFPDTYSIKHTDLENGGIWVDCPKNRIRFSKPPSEARKESGRRLAAKSNISPA